MILRFYATSILIELNFFIIQIVKLNLLIYTRNNFIPDKPDKKLNCALIANIKKKQVYIIH